MIEPEIEIENVEDAKTYGIMIICGRRPGILRFQSSTTKQYFFSLIKQYIPDVIIINCDSSENSLQVFLPYNKCASLVPEIASISFCFSSCRFCDLINHSSIINTTSNHSSLSSPSYSSFPYVYDYSFITFIQSYNELFK